MGNGYNRNLHHQTLHPRATFLPMLCSRTWIKDVQLPKLWPQSRRGTAASAADVPSSPRVGCMGQVKRSSKVNAYTKTTNHNMAVKYSTTNSNKLTSRSTSVRMTNFNVSDRYDHHYVPVSVADMDPPLPVVKRVEPPSRGGDLWKRRSGGMGLKSLQIHTTQAEVRKQRLIEKYKDLKASGKLESFIEKRRRKNAAKDHRYMPYQRSNTNGQDP